MQLIDPFLMDVLRFAAPFLIIGYGLYILVERAEKMGLFKGFK
jgi:hypothetical protein